MNYWGADKPIHEFRPEDLELAFNGIWDSLEYMFTYEEVSQKDVDEIIDYVSTIVKTLIDVLKKSLIYFYPQHSADILEFTNICKSTKDYHLSLYRKDGSLTIIRKGIDALESLDKFSYAYLIHGKMKAGLNPCYHEKLPLSNEVLKRKKNDFETMKSALESYCLESKEVLHFIQINKIKKNIEEAAKEITPLVKEGKNKIKQLHAPKEKRNKYILKYCRELKKTRTFTSAEQLLKRFPEREKPAEIDGAKVFKELTDNGDLKAFCIMPDGEEKSVSLRKLQNYYDEKYKNKKKS
jgi:hypothetical protein